MSDTEPTLDTVEYPDIPRPILGERLFRGDLEDWRNNACPHWYSNGNNWSLIATGYRHAADKLVDMVIERQALADEMLYPVCFLYRHFVELALKEIIGLGNLRQLGDWRTEEGHNLSDLWKKTEPVLRGLFSRMQEEELEAVGKQIAELQEIDPKADGFRFPKTKKTKNQPAQVTLAGLRHVNLRHMRDVMAGIASLLEGSIERLSEAISA